MDFIGLTFFIPSTLLVIWGTFIATKYYLSEKTRFEDYYLLLAIASFFGKFLLQSFILVTNNLSLSLVFMVQALQTWTYWFLLIFLFKRNFFEAKLKRVLWILLTLIIVIGSTILIASSSFQIDPVVYVAKYPTLMKMDYLLDDSFVNTTQYLRVFMLGLCVWFSWRLLKKPSWMFFGASFLFLVELFTFYNNLPWKFLPSCFIFRIIQVFELISIICISLDMKLYFGKRDSK